MLWQEIATFQKEILLYISPGERENNYFMEESNLELLHFKYTTKIAVKTPYTEHKVLPGLAQSFNVL